MICVSLFRMFFKEKDPSWFVADDTKVVEIVNVIDCVGVHQ